MTKTLTFFTICLSLLTLVACATEEGKTGKVIAQVFEQKLYEDQIKRSLGTEYFNEEYRSQYVDSWIKKQLLLRKAKADRKHRSEVNKLVNDYRESLLIQKHKENYLEKNLSLDISDEKLMEAYLEIKDDYKLVNTIFKAEILITPVDHFDKLDLKSYFKKGNYDEWKNSLANLVDLHLQDTTTWYTWREIQQYLPSDLMSEDDLEENEDYSFENDKHLFFVRIFDVIDEKQTAPLSYMEDKLKNAILERSKESILNDYSAELYKSALQDNKIVQ